MVGWSPEIPSALRSAPGSGGPDPVPTSTSNDITELLERLRRGEPTARSQVFALVYGEFRALAGRLFDRERGHHTLQPTALVHEAYMKLFGQERVDWKSRTHFYAVGAQAMRRVLTDYARARGRDKRGGAREPVSIHDAGQHLSDKPFLDALDLTEALTELSGLDAVQARIVEMRFFTGLTMPEVAEVLGLGQRTAEREWTMAKAWLRRRLESGLDRGEPV